MVPLLSEMTKDECHGMLRRLELESYSTILSVFRAQGALCQDKVQILESLRNVLRISYERHRAEARRVANDEKLCTIANILYQSNSYQEWSTEGRRLFPLSRHSPLTAMTNVASNLAKIALQKSPIKIKSEIKQKSRTNRNPNKKRKLINSQDCPQDLDSHSSKSKKKVLAQLNENKNDQNGTLEAIKQYSRIRRVFRDGAILKRRKRKKKNRPLTQNNVGNNGHTAKNDIRWNNDVNLNKMDVKLNINPVSTSNIVVLEDNNHKEASNNFIAINNSNSKEVKKVPIIELNCTNQKPQIFNSTNRFGNLDLKRKEDTLRLHKLDSLNVKPFKPTILINTKMKNIVPAIIKKIDSSTTDDTKNVKVKLATPAKAFVLQQPKVDFQNQLDTNKIRILPEQNANKCITLKSLAYLDNKNIQNVVSKPNILMINNRQQQHNNAEKFSTFNSTHLIPETAKSNILIIDPTQKISHNKIEIGSKYANDGNTYKIIESPLINSSYINISESEDPNHDDNSLVMESIDDMSNDIVEVTDWELALDEEVNKSKISCIELKRKSEQENTTSQWSDINDSLNVLIEEIIDETCEN